VEAAGNEILLQLHDSLRDRQSRMGLAALASDRERTGQILAEHEQLARAITDGDRQLALARIDAHLHGTLALLRRGA
jgi:DNA-binding FadR family transcriptional regulator